MSRGARGARLGLVGAARSTRGKEPQGKEPQAGRGCDPRGNPGTGSEPPASSGRQDGLWGTGIRPPALPSPCRGDTQPLAPAPGCPLGVGTARPPPPPSLPPPAPALFCLSQEEASSEHKARGRKAAHAGAVTPLGTLRDPLGASYLRGPGGGTAPWPEHRPPLAAPARADNGPGNGTASPAPRSPPPAPSSWRGTAGRGGPGWRIRPGALGGRGRKRGQRYLRPECDLPPPA